MRISKAQAQENRDRAISEALEAVSFKQMFVEVMRRGGSLLHLAH